MSNATHKSAQRGFSIIEGGKPPSSTSVEDASRKGIHRPHGSHLLCAIRLLPLSSKGVVRCSPRLVRCSNVVRNGEAVSSSRKARRAFRTTTTSVHRTCGPSVDSVGVGHSELPVKGNRLRSLEPLCPRRVQVPTQKQEALSSTSEGRVAPSAVGQGSSHTAT